MAKSGCWLFKPTHKTSHYFSASIQPTYFRSTPSSLVIEINSRNQNTDIWAGTWYNMEIGIWYLVSLNLKEMYSTMLWWSQRLFQGEIRKCHTSSGSSGSLIWPTGICIAKTYGNNHGPGYVSRWSLTYSMVTVCEGVNGFIWSQLQVL